MPSKPWCSETTDAILNHKHRFYIPTWTQEVHHEVELVIKISRIGKPFQNIRTCTTTKWGWALTLPRATCRRN